MIYFGVDIGQREIADNIALEAPFGAQKLGDKRMAGAGLDWPVAAFLQGRGV